MQCPICGDALVTIEGRRRCLFCGFDSNLTDSTLPQTENQNEIRKNQQIRAQAHKNLLNNVDGSLDYCRRRGLGDRTIEEWSLGYVSANQYTMPSMWRRRLLFPIMHISGTYPLGFGARIICTEDRPKYVNSPNGGIYDKSKTLFGAHLLPDGAETVYLCEGYMDVLAMDANGFSYPVASLGTALTKEQAALLRSKAQTVVLAYDADDAGRKGLFRAVMQLLRAGFYGNELSVLQPKGAKDVDEALTHGAALCEYSLSQFLARYKQFDVLLDAAMRQGRRKEHKNAV